ncbi:ABC transporter substrate-binding protein [Martelella radicis]|uniref:ABC-type transport system substrate-binding protein n=1 Tax=Martelella radicis TaxID=1397476 RepID=A0A7W6KR46_9HYPH|nr:ABC transporter substrate-binding protein [Martelella radicis]MBB4124565.1 ABC-type transport system substrate-binding protein [Martelella radicis]
MQSYGKWSARARLLCASALLASGLSAPAIAEDDSFFTLTLMVGEGNSELAKIAQIMAQDFGKIGIDVDLQFIDFAAISPRYKLTSKTGVTFEDGGYDIYFSGTSLNTFPDPSGIYVRYGSDQFYPNGNNRTRYVNPEFDELIYEALATPNDEARWETTKEAVALLREDFANVPIYRTPKINLVRTDIAFPENKSYYGWESYAARWATREVEGKSADEMTPREKTLVVATDGSGLEAFLPGFHDNDDTTRALNYMAYDALLAPTLGSYATRDGGKKGPKPALATDWEISEDGKTWTFHLADGATWHDGVPLTADDVMFTYDLIKNPDAGYGSSKFIETNGVSWKKLDDKTVEFTAETFSPLFASEMFTTPIVAEHVLGDMPPAEIKTSEYNTTTVIGTGPFVLDVYQPGEFIRWKANDEYYGGRPFFDYVTFKVVPTKTAAFYAMKAGEVDITNAYGFTRELEEINANPEIGTIEQPDISMEIVRINHDHPELSKLGVRKAMSLATNRQVIADVVFDGLARPADQMVPDWNPAYSPDLPPLVYDLNEAKKALVEAGFDYDTISIDGPQ